MLRSLFGLDQPTQQQSDYLPPASPFGDWRNALSTAGLALLAKRANRDTSFLDVLPMAQKMAEANRASALQQKVGQAFQASLANADPKTKALAGALIQAGSYDKAYELLKPAKAEPYTLGKDQIRYGANNEIVARGPQGSPDDNKLKQGSFDLRRWESLPATWRSNYLAIANGMGISSDEALDAFTSKKSLKQLAKERGIDENMIPDPSYPPTNAQINAIQQRTGAVAEMKVLDDFITGAQKPYSQRVAGISPTLTKDSALILAGKAKEDVKNRFAQNVAAKILQTENFAARFKSLGGNVSESAIENLMRESLADFKIPGITLTPEIWGMAQEMVKNKLMEAATAANRSTLRSGMPTASYEEANAPSSSTPPNTNETANRVPMIFNGKPVLLRADQVEEALKTPGWARR